MASLYTLKWLQSDVSGIEGGQVMSVQLKGMEDMRKITVTVLA